LAVQPQILLILPKNQYCEGELAGVLEALAEAGLSWVALSKSGREASGLAGGRFQPGGVIVDWDRQPGFAGKYEAVILIGGRGAKKFLWDDPIVPQILTDHHRAGKLIAACGLAVAVLARAGFLAGEASGPDDDPAFLEEMARAGAALSAEPVTRSGNIVTGRGASAAGDFGRCIVRGLMDPAGG